MRWAPTALLEEGAQPWIETPLPTSLLPPLRQVLRNKGVYESVKYLQQENFWIGPGSVRAQGTASQQEPWACLLQLGREGLGLPCTPPHQGTLNRGARSGPELTPCPP